MNISRITAVVATLLVSSISAGTDPQPKIETRCGWWENPSPSNVYLTDKEAQWLVSAQGGHQADGDAWPTFEAGQHVKTGSGSYGYGCACLQVVANHATHKIERVVSARANSLRTCRDDPALKEPQGLFDISPRLNGR